MLVKKNRFNFLLEEGEPKQKGKGKKVKKGKQKAGSSNKLKPKKTDVVSSRYLYQIQLLISTDKY